MGSNTKLYFSNFNNLYKTFTLNMYSNYVRFMFSQLYFATFNSYNDSNNLGELNFIYCILDTSCSINAFNGFTREQNINYGSLPLGIDVYCRLNWSPENQTTYFYTPSSGGNQTIDFMASRIFLNPSANITSTYTLTIPSPTNFSNDQKIIITNNK
jgi:hypothetical protein